MFYKHSSHKDGLQKQCINCRKNFAKIEYSNNRDYYITHSVKWGDDNPIRKKAHRMIYGIKSRKNKDGIEADLENINLEYIFGILKDLKFCECCGRKFGYGRGSVSYDSPSIDRFDSDKGYTIDNINIICWRCNNIKNSSTIDDLEMVARWMKRKILSKK